MGLFDYIKKNWKDYPDTSTPVNAANLNHMDNQIAKLSEGANSHEESIGTIEDRLDGIDSSLNEIENKFVFSSNETLVGTFLGKNLYRKVITYTVTESNKTKVITFAHNIKNVDLIMIGQSVVKDKNGNFKSVNFINNDIQPSNICHCSADTTNIKLFCGNTLFVTGDVTAYITLEYTKTSDG